VEKEEEEEPLVGLANDISEVTLKGLS